MLVNGLAGLNLNQYLDQPMSLYNDITVSENSENDD